MKRLNFVILLSVLVAGAFAQSTVKGYVFNDVNKDGKKSSSEKGIANVAVSNGRDVVVTDAKGAYQLPIGDDNIIFVIKPKDYDFALDENNLPRYYYIHKPNGSPESHYKGVAPTGKLPKSVDFGLRAADESDEFTALVFGDSQPYVAAQLEFFKQMVVEELKREGTRNAKFGITLGDLVGDDLNLHSPYKGVIKEIGLPWHNVMGNHDMNYDAPSDSLSDETFEAHFGPNNYAFNYGNAHFIVLDDILYPDPRDGKGYWGGYREAQLAFVENNLKFVDPSKLIVISQHIPLQDKESRDAAFRGEDKRKLYDLLKKYPNVLMFSAHTHIQYNAFAGKEEGVDREKPIHEYNVGTTCGDWYSGPFNDKKLPVSTMRDGTPPGYVFLTIKGNEYTLDYKVIGKPADYRMAIYNPHIVPYKTQGSYSVYANVFMANAGDVVEFKIDDNAWTKMKQTVAPDPDYTRYVQDWDYIEKLVPGRRPSQPVDCAHLWSGKISANLPIGEHTITVRTTDMYGRTFTQQSVYRIEKDPTAAFVKE